MGQILSIYFFIVNYKRVNASNAVIEEKKNNEINASKVRRNLQCGDGPQEGHM